MALRSLLIILLHTGLTTQMVSALVIRQYNANRHNRFTGYPSNPVINPQFLFASHDFSGVGWNTSNTNFQYTLVSPMHFVGANHIKPGIGHNLRFVATDGTIRNYTVAATVPIKNAMGQNSDLFIGRLTVPIASSDNVSFHPYLNLNNDAAYVGEDVMFFGKPARAGTQTITQITYSQSSGTNQTRTLRTIYNPFFGDDDDAHLEVGDSGSPVFIDHNGIAAIVGTHSLVGNNGVITNHSNFVPFYADKLNTVMATHGYHMTKAIPGSTNLLISRQIPATTIRAGHAFDIHLTINNTGNTRADNLKLSNTFPAGSVVNSTSGTNWFDQSSPTQIEARRASLNQSGSTVYSMNLMIPTPGTHPHAATALSNQSSSTTANFNIEVIGSFLSFAANLANSSTTGDDDRDGIINLLEYVFGGDPTLSSQLHPGTSIPLLPVFTQNGSSFRISYLRRKDYVQRAISYDLESSGTMADGSWGNASSLITNTTVSSINSDFEQVTYDLSGAANEQFFRINVSLNE